jgi:hypothetical protein
MTSIKGRAATEQDALARIFQFEKREGGIAVQIRLQRAPDMSVEYSALIVAVPNIVQDRGGN